jgi:hypothetical protein
MQAVDLIGLLVPLTYLAMLAVETAWPARRFPPRRGWRWLGIAFLVAIGTVSTIVPLLIPVDWLAAHRWPKLFPLVALHRLNMPAGIRFIESVVSVIDAKMQDPELTARHFRAMGYFLIGACLEETAGYAKGPSAAEPVDDDFVAREAPHLTRVARYFAPSEWQQTWQLGVDALIARGNADAAAAAAKRPGPRREAPRRRAAKRNP